jgi:DNA-directed RNA polymerase specialized sigma24 family protein
MGWESADPQRLSYQEVLDALNAMSELDWKKAEWIAQAMGHRLPGMTAEDLLQEVCTRFLSGERRFPKGHHTLVVLKTAMRSEASNVRKAGRASLIDSSYRTDPAGESEDPRLVAQAVDRRSPEVEEIAKQQLESLSQRCAGDENAELVMMAWADGLRGDAAREATGLSSKDFDAARKRATRMLVEIKSEGKGS